LPRLSKKSFKPFTNTPEKKENPLDNNGLKGVFGSEKVPCVDRLITRLELMD
jgi:hypothetical protein